MMRHLALLAAALCLTACSPAPREPASAAAVVDTPRSTPAPSGPDSPVSSSVNRPSGDDAAPPPVDRNDPCEARRFQHLVGKPRTEVPTPPPNRTWRVYSTEDAVTEDYSETRMNVMWDAATGRVLSVKCG